MENAHYCLARESSHLIPLLSWALYSELNCKFWQVVFFKAGAPEESTMPGTQSAPNEYFGVWLDDEQH